MDNTLALDKFFELSDQAMLVTDLTGIILRSNSVADQLINQVTAQLQGNNSATTIDSLAHPEDQSLIHAVLEKLECERQATPESVRVNCFNQAIVWIEWSAKTQQGKPYIYWIGRDITELKRKEAFLDILEEVTDTGVWELESETNKLHWSKKIHEIHETDSKTYSPVIEEALNFYAEEAVPILLEALNKQDTTGKPYNLNLPFVTAKKQRRLVNARSFTQKRNDAVIRRFGTFKDVTREFQQEAEKRKLTNRMSLALEVSQIGVWEFDLVNQQLLWDQRMFEIYDVSPRHFRGELIDWEETVVSEDLGRAKSEFEDSMETGEYFISQFRINTQSSGVRHIKALASNVYDTEGKLTHIVGVNRDVTEDIKQQMALESAKERSEAANKAKSQFLATMSHEIRTPLNGIIGSLQVLKGYVLPEQGHQLISKSFSSATSLLGIINDILDYTKITEDKIDLEILKVDVKKLLQQIVDEQAILCDSAGVQLILEYADDCPTQYLIDPTRFRQIITNLTTNAIKFSPQGNVTVQASAIEDEDHSYLQVTVTDNGVGMSQSQVEKLFEPFVQADSSTTRKFGGTGLGLSIVKKLVELMGGAISVGSELGKGSRFTINLPFDLAGDSVQTSEQTNHPSCTPDFSGMQVMVAEDNELNQILIEIMLKETGATVVLVEDGEKLLERLNKQRFDIVLCDINMPGMGGIEACKKIRQVDNTTPVLAFTANVMREDVKQYIEVGFNDVIPKPVIREELFDMLKQFLNPEV